MTRSRPASIAAGLSLAATFILALPLAAHAGAHGCNCGTHAATHAAAAVHTAVRTSVHVQASAYSHAGYAVHTGGYTSHTGGYSTSGYVHPHGGPRPVMHYPTHDRQQVGYTDQGGYHSGGNYSQGGYSEGGHQQRVYDRDRSYGGNSYSVVYAPTYDDNGSAGDYSGGYAAAAPADYGTANYGSPDYGSTDYGSADYGDSYAPPPADEGYAYNDAPQYSDNYADTGYSNAGYADTSYASPPPANYNAGYSYARTSTSAVQGWRDDGGAWHCGRPVVQTSGPSAEAVITAYGWRDQYGEWHVTKETRHYSYSYSY